MKNRYLFKNPICHLCERVHLSQRSCVKFCTCVCPLAQPGAETQRLLTGVLAARLDVPSSTAWWKQLRPSVNVIQVISDSWNHTLDSPSWNPHSLESLHPIFTCFPVFFFYSPQRFNRLLLTFPESTKSKIIVIILKYSAAVHGECEGVFHLKAAGISSDVSLAPRCVTFSESAHFAILLTPETFNSTGALHHFCQDVVWVKQQVKRWRVSFIFFYPGSENAGQSATRWLGEKMVLIMVLSSIDFFFFPGLAGLVPESSRTISLLLHGW